MPPLKRTILVTGASSGIGRAIARELITEGHQVIGISRDLAKFATTRPNFHARAIDLSDLAGLPKQIEALLNDFPSLNTAIFSAGAGRFGCLEEFSCQQIEQTMRLNFLSPATLTRLLLPAFKRRSLSDLIYIGSEAGLKGSRQGTMYCAAKFALRGFTQALREECSRDGVRVSLVNPGMVKSPFFDTLGFEPGDNDTNHLLPEDVAATVSFILRSRSAAIFDEINLNPANKVVKKKGHQSNPLTG